MMISNIVLLLLVSYQSEAIFLHKYPEVRQIPVVGDPGEKLILTPYINSGKLDEAKNASRVGAIEDGVDVESYSGFLTVDETYDSNLFFWYFPPENQNYSAPVVLWLQGGPGSSSLLGLFNELGPYEYTADNEFKRRQYSWGATNHLLFIDNPVGTGFSFTNSSDGYATDQLTVGNHLHTALLQFFTLFPDLQKNDFFIAGESYAGKYVPAAGYAVLTKNPTADLKINLKGLAIGNGLCDPVNMVEDGELLYELGLIDVNEREYFRQTRETVINFISKKDWIGANLANYRLSLRMQQYTGFSYNMNLLYDKGQPEGKYDLFVQQEDVRRALHVGDAEFHNTTFVLKALLADAMQSVAPWISELLSHYRILIYNGQLDLNVSYARTLRFLQALKFDSSEEYKVAKRFKWIIEDEIAGYVKIAGNLTEILVRNAGHMVPMDQPKWGFDLIRRFATGQSFE